MVLPFDRSLTFTTHLKEVNAKALKRSNIFKALSGKEWGCNDESLRSLYLTYIRAAIEYAGGAWMPCVSDTNCEQLEITQRQMPRTIAGCVPGTTNDALIREANLIPLNCRKMITATKLFEKAQRFLNCYNIHKLASKKETILEGTGSSIPPWETKSNATFHPTLQEEIKVSDKKNQN